MSGVGHRIPRVDTTVRERQHHGMGNRRIHDEDLRAHFVTFSCYRRRHRLDHDRAKGVVLGELNSQLARRKARCVGFVVMPDHVHAIVWFPVAG